MRDKHNRTGTAYALTTFTAILPGHVDEVRAIIEGVPRGAESPLARLTQLHTSRLQIFDKLVYQGAPQKYDELKNAYLVFTAAFDGAVDRFLDDVATTVPEADSWWRHCVAYPGLTDRATFRRWIYHNQLDTSLFGVNSQNVSVAQVKESLAARERVVQFAIAAQGLDANSLQQRFHETFMKQKAGH